MNLLLRIIVLNISIQSVVSFGPLREFFFPRHPNLQKIRKLDLARGQNLFSDVTLDFIGLVEYWGYPAEEHNLTTEDGYNLKIHRVPGSPKSPPEKGKPVVLLEHGLFCSSDYWVLRGPGKDLVFLLADAGYDVWIGNARGNTYCRSHKELSTSDREFWKFSFHEIAVYDVAETIDYALNLTSQETLFYIGHSMGTTTSYILLSTKPDYNKKIKLSISFGPVAIWKVRPNNILYQILTQSYDLIKGLLDKNDIYDLLPQTDHLPKLLNGVCSANKLSKAVCTTLFFLIGGFDPDQFNSTLASYLFRYIPAGSSLQAVDHYTQNVKRGDFRQYDYGTTINLKIYGKKLPPLYDLKKITAPFVLFYSGNDHQSLVENVMELAKKLQNVKLEKVPHDKFNHFDYFMANDAKTIIYDRVLDIMSTY